MQGYKFKNNFKLLKCVNFFKENFNSKIDII